MCGEGATLYLLRTSKIMMPLGTVVGAIMSDLAQARRIADVQAVEIARIYQEEPLLKGLSVPRIRLASVVVDLPAIVDKLDRNSLLINTDTSLIKEMGSHANVARFQLTFKEEGVEWHELEDEDGTITQRLLPE